MGDRFGGLAKTDPRLTQLIDRSIADLRSRDLAYLVRRIAVLAREIVGCEAATVTVLDNDGGPEHVISVGTHAEVPDPATDVFTTPELAQAQLDETLTRLIVPLTFDGRFGGGLYLYRPHHEGGFTTDDMRAAEAIAAAIVGEVRRTRTAAENRRRARWYAAGTELARTIASARHSERLGAVAENVRVVAEARRVAVLRHDPANDSLTVDAVVGDGTEACRNLALPASSTLCGRVLMSGTPMAVGDCSPSELSEDELRLVPPGGALLIVPLPAARDRSGLLAIARDATQRRFSEAEASMAMMLAGQVGLALELANAYDRRDDDKLLQERDRIARDLHDHVIQRLFALGMTLQSVPLRLPGPEAKMIDDAVDEIDGTIRQIRATIYQLTGPVISEALSMRVRIDRLTDELTPVLGFRPRLVVRGPIDFGVGSAELVDDCVAVLREALTNVARHAGATETTMTITATPLALRIEVVDNGRGIGASTRRSGLANLRARAERHGGSSTVSSDGPNGTALTWTVPLDNVRVP